jgi:enoyl-CoA hydratase/carnithine racemase
MFAAIILLFGAVFTKAVPLLSEWASNGTNNYNTLSYNTSGNVTRVIINNPPTNLCNYELISDLYTLLTSLEGPTPSIPSKVFVFSSANPDFFISHADIHQFSKANPLPESLHQNATLNNIQYFAITRLLASLPQIFVVEISGRAFGTGQELAVQMDMRFASPGAALGGLEVALGDFPGVGGLQYMAKLVGMGKAAQLVLGQQTVGAEEAERIGLVNKAFRNVQDMEGYVDALGDRIGVWPEGGIIATKRGLRDGAGPTEEAIRIDGEKFIELSELPALQTGADRFLELTEDETRSEFELGLTENLVQIYE